MSEMDFAQWNWAEWTLFIIALDLVQLLAASLALAGVAVTYRKLIRRKGCP